MSTEHPLNIARQFIEQFGFRDISVDKLDTFIVDHGLASDPETDDTTSIEWKGFIQERSNARNLLNRHGRDADEPFQIVVQEAGISYAIRPYTDEATDSARDIGRKVARYTKNRVKSIVEDGKKFQQLLVMAENNGDIEKAKQYREALARCALIHRESAGLDRRITAEVLHLSRGIQLAEAQNATLLEHVPEEVDREGVDEMLES